MSQSKLLAALLVGLLALTIAPPPASAQGAPSDLVVTTVRVDPAPVVGRQSTVTITVLNQGGAFTSNTPWEVFVGFDALTDEACIDTVNPPLTQTCRVAGPREIGANTAATLTTTWTPSAGQKAVAGRTNFLLTWIRPVAGLGTPDQGPGSGPDGVDGNNRDGRFPVAVAVPGVRAYPDRAKMEGQTVNTAWTLEEARKYPCKRAGETTRTGCRAAPGSLVEFSYWVENLGNVRDTIAAREIGTQQYRDRGYRFFLAPETVTLDPGQASRVTLQIEIPANERVDRGVNVATAIATLEFYSTLDTGVTSSEPPNPPCTSTVRAEGTCSNPIFPTVVADVRRAFWAEANETYFRVRAGESMQYNVSVNNTGNAPDSFAIAFEPDGRTINDSWVPTIQSHPRGQATGTSCNQNGCVETGGEQLAPGYRTEGNKNATVTITPPANATRGLYAFDVRVQSILDPASGFKRFRFYAELEQRYNQLSAGALTSLVRVVPGETASYTIPVTNGGNGPDNVTITLENVPPGWTRSLSTTAMTIPAFSTIPLTLNVTPPAGTVNGTEGVFFVNVTSQGDPLAPPESRQVVSVRMQLTVLRGPNLELTTTPAGGEAYVDPAGSADYEIVVRNVGNVEDNFTISATKDPTWGLTLQPSHVVLRPLESATIRARLTAPGIATVGEISRAKLTFQSAFDSRFTRDVTLTGRVSGPDLVVQSVNLPTANPYSGDSLSIEVVVENRGNKAPDRNTTLRVEALKEGVATIIAERPYAPGDLPGGLRLVETITWNTTGVEGAVLLRARIDVADLIKEIDDTPTSNEATRAVTLRVFDIKVTAAQPLSGRPGERVTYGQEPNAFIIEYRGNQDNEPVRVLLESEHGWGRKEFDLGLKPFSPVALPIDIQIPAQPGVPRDTLRLVLTPALAPTRAIASAATTTVIDDAKPEIVDVTATPETANVGATVTLSALLRDATGIAEARAIVVAPGSGGVNETLPAIPLTLGADGRFSAAQSFTTPGTYRYYVIARDQSASGNVNDSADVVRTFRVTSGSEPVIRLATNQTTTIRTGAPIKLDISDPAGIAKASYTVRGITFPLERPFDTIETSNLAAGSVDISITAENVYGATKTQRYTFTVDNTPPTIRRVTLNPAEPKVNEEVTIRVETDGDATSVDVVVKRGDQIVQTIAARRNGNAYEAKLNPGEGDFTIDVTAKDAAGNAQLKEGAAAFTTKPDSLIPGPGALGVLAALGAALVLLRGRRRA